MSLSVKTSSPISASSTSPAILTPGRRVKALLAQFDDSDSEDEVFYPREKNAAGPTPSVQQAAALFASDQSESESGGEFEDEDEDSVQIAPRGRLAARLQAKTVEESHPDSDAGGGGKAYDRIKSQLQSLKTKAANSAVAKNLTVKSSSEDELAGAELKRRLLKRKNHQVAEGPQDVASPRSTSPLFLPSPSVRKARTRLIGSEENSDLDELPANPLTTNNSRFLELIEKHHKHRLAQEAADVVKRAARVEQLQSLSKSSGRPRGSSPADDSNEDSDLSNHDVGRKLSKASRPTRKASKKAVEEMHRETQRMTRNMQLAHQAKTKKKITKESLLARFNFPVPGVSKNGVNEDHVNSATASSAPTSDAEVARKRDTPPTSPLLPDLVHKDMSFLSLPTAEMFESSNLEQQNEEELPTMQDVLTQPVQSVAKGKGRAMRELSQAKADPKAVLEPRKEPRLFRVKWSKEDAVIARAADSDSDLEIVTSQARSRKIAIFEALPSRKAREMSSHLALRSLAHITNPSNRKRSSMNTAQMETGLRRAARLQARKERQEKIEELKAKGIVIQTTEERERDQQDVEDLVERARKEADEIQKREKATAKKDGTFVKDGLDDEDSDDEEDGDFEDEDDAEADNIDEEDDDDDEGDEEDGNEKEEVEDEDGRMALDGPAKELFDQETEEQYSDESQEDPEEDQLETFINDGEEGLFMAETPPRRSRNNRVLSDDEDEESPKDDDLSLSLPAPAKITEDEQATSLQAPAKTPQSVPRSARKMIPGLQMSDDLPMGLTQAFAATMAESQSQDITSRTQQRDYLAMTRELPSPGFPIVPNLGRLESLDVITDSQPASQTQPLDVDLSFSQSQHLLQSQAGIASTQLSQMPFEPTQDVGFVLSPFVESRFDTPLKGGAPHSTVETVILPRDDEQSPIVQRKGRLRRGRAALTLEDGAGDVEKDSSAFDVMRRAAARKETEQLFDKSKSHAKDIVDEAAEESEDEYAGLGGASDDEAGEEDEDDRKMIDHDEKVGHGDEAKLAGLFADKERKLDEAAVSKLLKDITTGALRRKRGGGDDLDLSDEEDEAARRREAKRREFARMRRELLKDEAVGKIAEDRKKEAFLKSIEDREAADDEDDIDLDAVETQEEDSQSQQVAQSEATDAEIAEFQPPPANNNKRKRPLEPSAADILNRLPPALRRTNPKAGMVNRRPATIVEIRESVSFLIEEPDSQSATPQYSSSDDEDADPESYVNLDRHLQAAADDENEDDGDNLGDFIVDDSQDNDGFKKPHLPPPRAPFAERRTKTNVVDRRSLLRQASSSSATASVTSKMAFFTSRTSSSDSLALKVPSLLRRATTNSSFGSASNASVSATGVSIATERGAPDQEKEVIRRGAGGRRNAVNFRVKPREEQMEGRVVAKKGKAARAGGSGFLGGLFRGDSWD